MVEDSIAAESTAEDSREQTRRALHAVAELVLAGPQYRESATIRMQVSPAGFRTVAPPDIRVEGDEVIAGERRCSISGRSAQEIGAALGIQIGAPEGLYRDDSQVRPDERLTLDPVAAGRITDAFAVGDTALREFAPDEVPVLWPEHFDLAIRVEDVNFGVSPGDGTLPEPYAYVGVDPVPEDPFWNAPFGATGPLADGAATGTLIAFFRDAVERYRTGSA